MPMPKISTSRAWVPNSVPATERSPRLVATVTRSSVWYTPSRSCRTSRTSSPRSLARNGALTMFTVSE